MYSLFATVSVGTLNGHTVAVLASIHPLSRSAGTTKRYGLGGAESGSEGRRATKKGSNFLMDKCRVELPFQLADLNFSHET